MADPPTADAVTAVGFTTAVRQVADEARRQGLAVPGFRSPPRLEGALRTIRGRRGDAVVAVRIRGRAVRDVVADLVEGVVAANGLAGEAAERARGALKGAVAPHGLPGTVPGAGFEPARPRGAERFKRPVSTDSTTRARRPR